MPNRLFLIKLLSCLILIASCAAGQGTGTLTVYFSPPAAQSSTVSGVSTETFDALSTGVTTTPYTSTAGIGTYTGSASNPYAILAHDEYGGATDSTHTSPTNYLGVGGASGSSNPVILTLAQPAAYFGFWWSAGDTNNRVDLYQGSTLFATFSTANLLTFLNNGSGTITALDGTTTYNTSAYYGNPNLTSGNDSSEPFVYISFVITGATIDKLAFYNTSASGSTFESDNHSVIFTGNTVTIPTSYVLVETLNLTPTAAPPSFSPAAGTYTSVQSVAISSATSGTSIRYTTDGSTPSETAGTVYSGAVTVSASQTINAIAYGTGLADSLVGLAAYIINLPTAATPTFSPAAGTYTSVQTVTISSTTSGASIRYTTDGSTPSETAGTLYSGSITVGATETLKAIAYKSGMNDSAVASAAYTIDLPVVATPTFNPAAGTYTSSQTVAISTTTSGASIRYTTDGSTPSEKAGTLYSTAVTVGTTETLKAIAYKTGMSDSAVASSAYTISPPVGTPTFNPVAGTYTTAQAVTISTTASGASIRYTTDGSTPSETAGTLYTAPITVGSTQTLKAIAYATGMTDSAVASATYTLPVSVSMTPLTAGLTAGQTQQFTATVVNGSTANVVWTVTPAGAGTISSAGLYTAPPCVTAQETVTITATSQADSTKSSSATVTLQYAGGYSYRRAVVIDHTKVPNTDQTNFPVLINSTDQTLASVLNGGHVASPNGYDLVFTSDSGCLLPLNYEVQSWNATTGQLTAWVQVPLLSHASDTPLYLCYGNPSITASQANPTGVWDTNYLAVYHLGNGSTLSVADSTGKHNAVNPKAGSSPALVSADGPIKGSALLSGDTGADSRIDMGFQFGGTDLTVQAWLKPQFEWNTGQYPSALGWLTSSGNNGVLLYYSASTRAFQFIVGYSSAYALAEGPAVGSDATLGQGVWQSYVGRFDSSTMAPTIWKNGVNITTTAQNASGSYGVMGDNAIIGSARTDGDVSWTGNIAEVRISNITRPDDWIAAE